MAEPVCVISGVGPGTGSALVRRFAAGGYRIAMLARNAERLADLAKQVPSAKAYVCDVSDQSQVNTALASVEREMGAPNVLIHNAVGGAWGTLRAFVPGVEATVAWRQVDFYLEGEYVHDSKDRDDSYWYAWTELGYRPAEWLRLGLAAQRTRAYGGERDIQRGPFVQLTFGPVTVGGYWFNPGSNEQVFVGQAGVSF